MIKVELTYNPYLMKTDITFDGRKPRINSLVEKYQHRKLQEWIKQIPEIFYNEMNGYDFELEFSGTKMDYFQLEKAFRDAGVSEQQVRLFHKNEIGEREEKVQALENLFGWLRDEQNNKLFDNDSFKEEYDVILNPEYSFVTINGDGLTTEFNAKFNIFVDNVDSIEELQDVELKNIPIVVCVTRDNRSQLQTIIYVLNQREDVIENQVYFIIDPVLNTEMVKRTIQDLGIKNLQIVESATDPVIRDYYYAFPVTDRLFEAIKVLNEERKRVSSVVEGRKQKGEIKNKEIHEEIRKLDSTIETLKNALIEMENLDNIEIPDGCYEAQMKLRKSIETWRKNKYKFPIEYSEKNADEFDDHLKRSSSQFAVSVVIAMRKQRNESEERIRGIYKRTSFDDFEPVRGPHRKDGANYVACSIKNELLQIKEEEYIVPKGDLKDRLFGDSETEKQPVLTTTFYFQQWRAFALKTYNVISDQFINYQYQSVRDYLHKLVENYSHHLKEAIDAKRLEKEHIVSKLSEEELLLEKDIDWLTSFSDKINDLERG